MRLLIDCGNSSIKFALNMKLEVKKIIEVRLNNPKKLSLDLSKTLNALLKKRNIEGIYLAFVNKEAKDILLGIIKKKFSNIKIRILTKRRFNNFKLNYEKPNTLGMDRFFNCIGSRTIFPNSAYIIVDIGTATTIDVVDKKFSYLGGLILPGPLTSYSSLMQQTSMIGNHKILLKKKILGASTAECLSSGFVHGQSLMIESIVNQIKKTYKQPFKVILTGGLSDIFKRFLPKNYLLDLKLTFKGVAFFIENQK
jgi:type III pantothenate kinase